MILADALHASERLAADAAHARFFPLKVKRPPSQWATEERMIAAGQSPLSGGHAIRYDHAVMPHAVEPMDAADDPSVNVIVLWWGIRMSKTEGVSMNIMGRTITDDPGNIYTMWPVEDSSERFSRDGIEPFIGATPALQSLFVEKKSRDSGRTIAYKRYLGGSMYFANAGSVSKTRGMAVKVLHLGEIDDPAYGAGREGDVIQKALGRTQGFGDAIKILESTGTMAPEFDEHGNKVYKSRIHQHYERGDMRKWFCPCRECGELQWLKFEQIKIGGLSVLDLIKSGKLENAQDARYHCERCDAAHTEPEWRELVAAGRWYATAGLTDEQLLDIKTNHVHARAADPVVRSYWINGFNSLLPVGKGYATKLHQFVAERAAVEGNPEALRVWENEINATLHTPNDALLPQPHWLPLFQRREKWDRLPLGCIVLTCGIDLQGDRIEVFWDAWGRDEENWTLAAVKLSGTPKILEVNKGVWAALTRELQRKFTREDGAILGLRQGFMDIGSTLGDYGARYLRSNPIGGGWILRASKGSSQTPHPLVERTPKMILKTLKGHWIGTNTVKGIIYDRIRLLAPRPGDGFPYGWIHFHDDLDESHFRQFTSEQETIKIIAGRAERLFLNERAARNEALDGKAMSYAAFRLARFDLDRCEAENVATIGKPQAPRQPRPPQSHRPAPLLSGLSAW